MSEVKIGNFAIIKNDNGGYNVTIDGKDCDNVKAAMRQIAEALKFEYDDAWTTRQFGAKLSKYIEENSAEAQTEAVKKAAEQAKAEAEAARKAAEAEVKRLQKEAEKAKAEAEKARIQAEKDSAEAKAEAEATKKASKSPDNEGALPGVFTLEDGRKICFSKGNLQFHCKNYEFRFAEEQHHVLRHDNNNIAPNYDGWIDLFGWGTSGFMGCQPTEVSLNESEYGPSEGDLDGTNFDWGAYNPIIGGGNKEGLWRTPNKREMDYILTTRPNADKLKFYCTVCDREGIAVIPNMEFWNNRLKFPINISGYWKDNQFDANQWKSLESLGCLFFPDTGYRRNDEKVPNRYDAVIPRYWSSTRGFAFHSAVFKENVREGFAVRLIKDIK